MPRPNEEDRNRIQANREANKRLRDEREARETQTYNRVKSIVEQALRRPRDTIDIDTILLELDEARCAALACYPPQSAAAIQASIAKAKLLGLLVERQEIGRPQDYEFERARTKDELLEMLQNRLGPAGVQRFEQFVSEIQGTPMIEHRNRKDE